MKYLLLAPLLLLGACSALDKDTYMTNAECRQTVYNDPDVRDLIAKMAASYRPRENELSLDDLKRQVYVHCLRAHDLAPKGGVEPVRRNWW